MFEHEQWKLKMLAGTSLYGATSTPKASAPSGTPSSELMALRMPQKKATQTTTATTQATRRRLSPARAAAYVVMMGM